MPRKTATAEPVDWKAPKLKGKVIAFTGTLQGGKAAAAESVKREGGKVVEALTDKVDYLVVGHTRGAGPTAAEKKARWLNQKGAAIQVLDESAFHALFSPTRDEAIAMLRAGKAGLKRWGDLRGDFEGDVPMPDLSGADLRGAAMSRGFMPFSDVKLDGADLRGADLTDSWLDEYRDVRFDGACLKECTINGLTGCSLRNADLSKATIFDPGLRHCDLTGANLQRVDANYLEATDVVFRNADLRGAELEEASFTRADFTGADLTDASLRKAKLAGAKLARAKLANADLTNANLKGADLGKADLGGANLAGADLTRATIDGANFDGANIAGAKVAGLDPARARGLDLAQAQAGGRKGPRLGELEKVAKQARELETSAVTALPDGRVVELRVGASYRGRYVSTFRGTPEKGHHSDATSISAGMLDLARQCGRGELRLDQVTAKGSKCPLKGKELRALAVAAWCEACGIDISSPEALQQLEQAHRAGQQGFREQLLADLRGGAAGVTRWNERSLSDRKRASHFRGVDLSGADLCGVNLEGLDFRGANFEGATLTQANLRSYADFGEANFKNADLKGAHLGGGKFAAANFEGAALHVAELWACNLRRANFRGANLRGADLDFADLRGADLSSAKLRGAQFNQTKYDEHTRLPEGFEPPEGMKWVGSGPAPAARKLAARQPAGPMDFDTFMQRLAQNTEKARLDKALKMLKADRFRLFAQAGDEQLVGVVKSQTDPDLVYSCKLAADGSFGCCTQNLNACGGLSGRLCKHLLVLLIGLAKAGEVDPARVDLWVEASRYQKPTLDKDAMSETLLRYKGAEAGEIDWRPTETVPEDYYAF